MTVLVGFLLKKQMHMYTSDVFLGASARMQSYEQVAMPDCERDFEPNNLLKLWHKLFKYHIKSLMINTDSVVV